MNHIANHLSTKELSVLEQEFRTMDSNLDGYITRGELADAIRRTGSLGTADEFLRELDINGDDQIDWNEYLRAAIARKEMLKDERIIETFRWFDGDKSGKISVDEMKKMLGSETDGKILMEMFNIADLNNDGEIDLDEFRAMLLKSVEPMKIDSLIAVQ